jgi:hypothetical protein
MKGKSGGRAMVWVAAAMICLVAACGRTDKAKAPSTPPALPAQAQPTFDRGHWSNISGGIGYSLKFEADRGVQVECETGGYCTAYRLENVKWEGRSVQMDVRYPNGDQRWSATVAEDGSLKISGGIWRPQELYRCDAPPGRSRGLRGSMSAIPPSPIPDALQILGRLGAAPEDLAGGGLVARTPVTGEVICRTPVLSPEAAAGRIEAAHRAFLAWRRVPAPRRGELVRLFGEELRAAKADLGRLVTLEAGKVSSEGLGEVQEMIDICDFAVGLSRQLYGLTLATERPDHRMMETWHPLGVVGVISAFNFPVAVWSWNAALALVCGDAVAWKPSEKTPLTALAVQALFQRAAARFGPDAPADLCVLLQGGPEVGEVLVDHPRVPLVSATGSTRMGRQVAPRLAARFARALLELGGNNAAILAPSADLELAIRAVAFAAMGTAGQRCTTLRRLFVHESLHGEVVERLKAVYARVAIGDPRGGRDPGWAAYRRGGWGVHGRGSLGGRSCGRAGAWRRAHRPAGDLRTSRPRGDAVAGSCGPTGDLRPDPLRHVLPRARGGHRRPERRSPGTVVVDLHP